MSWLKAAVLVLVLATALSVVVSSPATQAAGVLDAACRQHGGAGADSAVCSDNTRKNKNNNPLTGDDGILTKVSNIVTVLAGVAAVIVIVVAGFRLITSGGSSEEVAGARRAIIYAAIGLVVIVLARVLIGFAISAT